VQNIKTASVVVITPGINDVRVNAASDIVIKLDDSEKKPKIVR
jgi:hypothetical protein